VSAEAPVSALVQHADVALYSSKKTGRNRVTCAEEV
jgi:PleD family two-component response regulator